MSEALNLLREGIFAVRTPDGERRYSLPEVLALLGSDELLSFSALQPHQQHAWHAFTVQLAALALHRNGETNPVQGAKTWAEWLVRLSGDSEFPWYLVAPLVEPAFLQPPVPEKSLAGWKGPRTAPDEIDILLTAKNHDVKSRRIRVPEPQHWVYALVTLQTMQGFLGAGNYGIARMNGGFSNRPGFGYSDGLSPGARFRGDVASLLERRDEIVDKFGFSARPKFDLLWMAAWDGKDALPLASCDPFFIEICRRIRLTHAEAGAVEAWGAPTKSARVAAEKGLTGDAWTPLKEGAALTVSGSGLNYQLLAKVLFDQDEYVLPAAMRSGVKRRDPHLIAQALARGQGKTEGLHERIVPLKGAAAKMVDLPEGRVQLGLQARARIETVRTVRQRILKPALCALFQGAPEGSRLDFRDDRPEPWLAAFEQDVDRIFFEHFFRTFQSPENDGLDAWKADLGGLAKKQLQSAVHGGPVSTQRRFAAEAMAEALFQAGIRKHLQLSPTPEENHDEPNAA